MLFRSSLPKIKPHMKFFFKKFGAAMRVAQIFRGIALRGYAQTYRFALK